MVTEGGNRLAADIGGTFTDIVLDTDTGRYTAKVLTTPQPEVGVLSGIDVVLEQASLKPSDIDLFVHGTTLATNALIERKGAKTAFLTTRGFRDILEMGFEKRFEHYDVFMDKPPPLVPRPLRIGVNERIGGQGQVLVPLDEDQVHAIAHDLASQEIGAVAVGLMHAYAFPDHERRIREILADELPDATVCLSSEVSSEIREYERFSTTCANAYIRPLMSRYLHHLAELIVKRGMTCPLFLMMSGGGLTTLDIAAKFPVRLVESGPAGGAILASQIAKECGLDNVLSFDMGGTTAKICLIEDGTPEMSRKFEVARMYRDLKGSGLPIRVPVIEMVEIGAGGGSIARVDEMGRVTIGPDSAGSDPGPACYGLGGDRATVTDANLMLGKLDPDRFAGGKITLDAERSRAAVARDVGDKLDMDGHWPAAAIAEIVEENMANAARVHAIERGKVIDRHTMIAFGGGAPLHAGRLAQKLGIRQVIVPKGAGVGSAIGFLRAPISFEVVRSLSVRFGDFDVERVNRVLAEMSAEARVVVNEEVLNGRQTVETRQVELRYLGQGHELPVPVGAGNLDAADAAGLRAAFEESYETIYGLKFDDMDIESVSWSVTVSTLAEPPAPAAGVARHAHHRQIGSAAVYDAILGDFADAPVFWRPDLTPGAEIPGPAIIAEDETSTIVPADFVAHVNSLDYIVMAYRAQTEAG